MALEVVVILGVLVVLVLLEVLVILGILVVLGRLEVLVTQGVLVVFVVLVVLYCVANVDEVFNPPSCLSYFTTKDNEPHVQKLQETWSSGHSHVGSDSYYWWWFMTWNQLSMDTPHE